LHTTGLALKELALALSDFLKADLVAAARVVCAAFQAKVNRLRKERKAQEADRFECLGNMHASQLVLQLPLETWKRTMRRIYGPAEKQSEVLADWYAKYILDATMFVVEGKTLIYSGKQGLDKFRNVWRSQVELVDEECLSGEHTCVLGGGGRGGGRREGGPICGVC
jgi:hypothetical protein